MLRAKVDKVWFMAAPAVDECKGCIFDAERVAVCDEACAAAVDAGMPKCVSPRGKSVCIYVRDPSDGRQADLLIGGEA